MAASSLAPARDSKPVCYMNAAGSHLRARLRLAAQAMTGLTYVWRRREAGQVLAPAEMLKRGPAAGLLQFGSMVMGPPTLFCWLFAPGPAAEAWDFSGRVWPPQVIGALKHARLHRDKDGVRLYRGVEDDGGWTYQAWLCTPTIEAGRLILARMAADER